MKHRTKHTVLTRIATAILVAGILPSEVMAEPGKERAGLLKELAETERSFAAMSVAEGMRRAFIRYFADDGYNFDSREEPIKPRQDFPKLPPQTGKPRYELDWFPIYTDVSVAGDLGLNTGPYVVRDSTGENPDSHGYFFSIWEKQTDGNWRVTVDIGSATEVPDARQKALLWATPGSSGYVASVPVDRDREIEALRKREAEFVEVIAQNGIAEGYRMYLARDARLHRNGIFPLTGTDDVGGYLSTVAGTLSWQPTLVKVSSSADLGYSWGKYRLGDGSAVNSHGHYCHVWKRSSEGEWKLVADILYPIEPS
jgi:ketosteroid isomerase-like protein